MPLPSRTALKAEGKCPKDTRHRQVKYLNNVVEADQARQAQAADPARAQAGSRR